MFLLMVVSSRVFGHSCHHLFRHIQTYDYHVTVNDTGNDSMLSNSYHLYHYLLPYKACHAPHMLAQKVLFSKSIDLLLLGEV